MSDVGRKSSSGSQSVSPTSKKSHWWSEVFHWTHGSGSSIDSRCSPEPNTGRGRQSSSSSSSSPEPKKSAAEEWRKERQRRQFLGGW